MAVRLKLSNSPGRLSNWRQLCDEDISFFVPVSDIELLFRVATPWHISLPSSPLAHQSGIMIIFIRDNQRRPSTRNWKLLSNFSFCCNWIRFSSNPCHGDGSGLIPSSLLHACYYRVRSKSQSLARVSYWDIHEQMLRCLMVQWV